jgi:putative ABC transport system permease protein
MRFLAVASLRMARRGIGALTIFLLMLSVAAVTLGATRGFHTLLVSHLAHQERMFLGADIVLSARRDIPEDQLHLARYASELSVAREIRFRSMVRRVEGASSGRAIFAQVRALEAHYPFGSLPETDPPDVWRRTLTERDAHGVLIDESLAERLGAHISDTVSVGAYRGTVRGTVKRMPGDVGLSALFAPRIYIPYGAAEATELVEHGSIVDRLWYLTSRDEAAVTSYTEQEGTYLETLGIELSRSRERNESLRTLIDRMQGVLAIVASFTLLLGITGVHIAVGGYLRGVLSDLVIYHACGVPRITTFGIPALTILTLGGVVIVIGAVIGGAFGYLIDSAVSGYLIVDSSSSIAPLLVSVATTVLATVGALCVSLVLHGLHLHAHHLNPSVQQSPLQQRRLELILWGIYAKVLLLSGVIPYLFGASIGAVLLLIMLMAYGVRALAKRLSYRFHSFVIRYATSSLYRPGNQTVLLITATALIAFLLGTTIYATESLQHLTTRAVDSDAPRVYALDVQPDQISSVSDIVRNHGGTVLAQTPIVLMRLTSVKDVSVKQLLKEKRLPHWTLTRQYWSSYRDMLLSHEAVVAGSWVGRSPLSLGEGAVPISIEDKLAEKLGVTIGDSLTFDIQGVEVKTTIASIRDILWERLQQNSFLVFPLGVLEEAPRFFVLSIALGATPTIAPIVEQLQRAHPNVILIDVQDIVTTVREVASFIEIAIIAAVVILCCSSFLLLLGAAVATRTSRRGEHLLLHAIGATPQQRSLILFGEFILLGVLGCGIGLVLSTIGGYALAQTVFFVPYTLPFKALITLALALIGTLAAVGLLPLLSLLRRKGTL